jgi:phage terminase Nu1 subunit (DNA packaging protein)
VKAQLVTKAKYAEMRGCAASAVTRAVKEGRITTIAGDGGREMIDPAVADIQWARNTRARADSAPALPDAASGPGRAPRSQSSSRPDDPAADLDPDDGNTYWSARARREAAEAEIAEMKLAEMQGLLIRADAVRSAWASKIGAARDALLQIPARLAPVLAAESDLAAVTQLLEAELRQALSDLSQPATAAPIVH